MLHPNSSPSAADPYGGPRAPHEQKPQTRSHVGCQVFRSCDRIAHLTGGSVEDMLGAVQATDVDCNVVLRMWRRITQARRLLRLPRARTVKSTALRRMTDFDDVTQEIKWAILIPIEIK